MTDSLLYSAQIIADLHAEWTPHAGQLEVGRAIFDDRKQYIFCENGRKWGKSEMANYFCWRMALSMPNRAIYYFAPFAKQARELVWANRRMQNFIKDKEKYIVSINDTEMRIRFKNGSFIKLDGSDNHEAYRGVTPHAAVMDEFKDFNPAFWDGFEPNLAVHKAPALFIGTPPETEDNQFCQIADQIKGDADGAYFNMPTSTNPHISKDWLGKMRQRLIDRGEYDKWLREYMAQRVKGGANHIFPMFDKKMVLNYDEQILEIKKFHKQWDFFITLDPATASTFAVLFTVVHKYNRKVIHLREVYAQSTKETSIRKVWTKVEEIINEINPYWDDWVKTYDEAGAWAANEILDLFGLTFMPTQKSLHKKENGLSLIKDQMNYGFWFCTDKCPNLIREVENYVRDDKGKIEKKNDHLIDGMRYTNARAYYSPIEMMERKPIELDRFEMKEKINDIERNDGDVWSKFDL